ncbi:hypothetical protein BGX34_008353, partial [Mortierella sp. NVP85]
MKELQGARYKRLTNLPPRISTTVAGVDYFLTEVRNVLTSPQDVQTLWPCEPKMIKILGIDLGEACVVGACAILPSESPPANVRDPTKPAVQNLHVKTKAVYQPKFKFRHWMESKKSETPADGSKSISDIETNLPPLKGETGSIV